MTREEYLKLQNKLWNDIENLGLDDNIDFTSIGASYGSYQKFIEHIKNLYEEDLILALSGVEPERLATRIKMNKELAQEFPYFFKQEDHEDD